MLDETMLDVAIALYDGGWRKEDKQEMLQTCDLDNDEIEKIIAWFCEFEKN